jgi:hypothetical protein
VATPTSISRFLRPTGIDEYEVHINGYVAATIWRVGNRTDDPFGAAFTDPDNSFLGHDANPLRLAMRIADGEFDSKVNDARFEIIPWDEPEMGCTHTVVIYAHPSQQEVERFTTEDPHGAVQAFREVQMIPMEERWEMCFARGW